MTDDSSLTMVLSGGGSLGAIQVGMLRALAEAGIQPTAVVGTSVGSINGLVVAGHASLADAAEQLDGVWRRLTRARVYPASVRGLIQALRGKRNHIFEQRGIREILLTEQPHRTFEDLALPFAAVAADVLTAEEVVFDSGDVIEAVLASSALPGIYPPVRHGGHLCVDGGVASHTPISQAVDRGASRIIVLSTGFSCALGAAPATALGMAVHSLNLIQTSQLLRDRETFGGACRISLVAPPCPQPISAGTFDEAPRLIADGYAAAKHWLDAHGLDDLDHIPCGLEPHGHP